MSRTPTDEPLSLESMDTTEPIVLGDKEVIFVRVRCINRSTKEFFDRDFWLDLDEIDDADRTKLRQLSAKHSVHGPEFRTVRHLLHEGQMPTFGPHEVRSFGGFSVSDYFEDEEGNPLDGVQLAQVMSGEEFPIMPYDVRSVLRLGPSSIVRKELWNTERANTLAHFFQLVEIIGNSRWWKSKLSIGTAGINDGKSLIHSFECPNLNEMLENLVPFRQLYASDNVFIHACNIYMCHTADERKRWWVKQAKARFDGYLDAVPKPMAIEPYTVRDVLDLTLYGSGMFHFGNHEADKRQAFKDLITNNQRERVIFLFVMYCQHLYFEANHVYHLALQDYMHWTQNEGCVGPDLHFLHGLFHSRRLRGEATQQRAGSGDEGQRT